jgi:hypothetical protein
MSGQYAIKGYIIQSLVAILDSFNDQDWISVCVEPNDESEKVDIKWEYNDGIKKVMQVKSSINPFTLPSVTKWANELENTSPNASDYILYLVGRVDDKVHKNNKIGNVNIKNVDISISDFNALILSKVNEYFENRNRNKINIRLCGLFALSLNQRFLLNSSAGRVLNRSDFEQYLLNDLMAVERYLEKSAYSLLLPIEEEQSLSLKSTIIKHILELIGWKKTTENETVTVYNEKTEQEEVYGVEYWSEYNSRLKDNEKDRIYINSSLEAEYPQNIQSLIKQNAYSVDLIRDKLLNSKKTETNNTSEHSVQFFLSTNEADLNKNLIDEITEYYKSSILNKEIIYYAIDNKKANFIISSIITARSYRAELAVKFLYPITEDTSTIEKIGKRDIYLPPQYINSSIIPIIKEGSKSKISVLMFCSDEYNKERLKKLIWMLIRLTSGLANEYIVYFPNYSTINNNEVNEIIRSYNDDNLVDKLKVTSLPICEATDLSIIPDLDEDFVNEEYDETRNKERKVVIQSHLREYLPYGDTIKPFLDSPAVFTPELKIFLSRKGIYFKNADKSKIIHLMTGLLFSPMEIESLVNLVEVKDKTLDDSRISYPLLQQGSSKNIKQSIETSQHEISKDIKATILSMDVKQDPKNNDFVVEVQLEQVNPNKQAMVSSVFSIARVSCTFNEQDKRFEVYKEYNSKPARTIADRVEKVISADLIRANIIEENAVKLLFSDFNNKDRANYLLSFTNINSSNIFTDYNAKSFKYMFDESTSLPSEYQDKIGKEYVSQAKGKNLDGVKELRDEAFKSIILCEEISINYKFNLRGVSGNYFVILNFSDALKNKPIPDGVFQFKGKVYLNSKNKSNVKNMATLENSIKQEFRRLQKEKLQLFNKI